MYLADGAYSICKPQASVLPWGPTEKCGAKPDPKLPPRGWWNRGFPWKCSSVSHLTRELQGSQNLDSPLLGPDWIYSEESLHFQLRFSPSTRVKYCCRFPVPVSYREKLCSCLQTGNALGFRHWLMTNAVLLFGLERFVLRTIKIIHAFLEELFMLLKLYLYIVLRPELKPKII